MGADASNTPPPAGYFLIHRPKLQSNIKNVCNRVNFLVVNFLFELWEEKMKKSLLSIAIIAALPFAANAANIQGVMYVAPAHFDNSHQAPTTNGYAPFGRINIDTTDQEHIATTAYVKGAYNSAIAAVNKVGNDKQDALINYDNGEMESISTSVYGATAVNGILRDYYSGDSTNAEKTQSFASDAEMSRVLVTVGGALEAANSVFDIGRVEIYTTWDTNNTTWVSLKTAYDF